MSTRDVGNRLIAGIRRDGARAAWTWLSRALTPTTGQDSARSPRPKPPTSPPPIGTGPATSYPGDFVGPVTPTYAPRADGSADPGEIVWAWVPFEEDHGRGKDRPVLVIGHDGPWLLALQLTSQDHDRDAAQEAREGRFWVDIGSGDWDPQRRPSEARVNRVIRVDPHAVRRIGARLDRSRFDQVAAAMVRGR